MKIEIYDMTLREGAQTAGVIFTDYEKLKIISELDRLGVDCIETGFFGADSADALAGLCKKASDCRAALSVLCQTRRPGKKASEDTVLTELAESGFGVCAVVGKASVSQVEQILGTTPEENIEMIADTLRFLRSKGKRTVFDAEHFFDGYAENPEYARRVVRAAAEAGADTVVLCDTNGGMLPDVIGYTVEGIKKEFPDVKFGIHCHNDTGMADACSVASVIAGVQHVQCTVMGLGERCGNASLSTTVPVLQEKLGFSCIPKECMSLMSETVRDVCQIANIGFDEDAPFVGGHAFMHKAGLHIDAVKKFPASFEHIVPETVGNSRSYIVSELSGRAAITEMLEGTVCGITKDSPETARVIEALKNAEASGCQYDSSGASLKLLTGYALGKFKKPFEILDYKLLFSADADPSSRWSAIVKIYDGETEQLRVGEGDGPVNALDIAAHLALRHRFPCIGNVRMIDIKARIDKNDVNASASTVRVFVEYGDGESTWRTMGASTDIIAASWQALVDAYEYIILSEENLI